MSPSEAKVIIMQVLLLPLYARVCLGTIGYKLVMIAFDLYECTKDIFMFSVDNDTL